MGNFDLLDVSSLRSNPVAANVLNAIIGGVYDHIDKIPDGFELSFRITVAKSAFDVTGHDGKEVRVHLPEFIFCDSGGNEIAALILHQATTVDEVIDFFEKVANSFNFNPQP